MFAGAAKFHSYLPCFCHLRKPIGCNDPLHQRPYKFRTIQRSDRLFLLRTFCFANDAVQRSFCALPIAFISNSVLFWNILGNADLVLCDLHANSTALKRPLAAAHRTLEKIVCLAT